MKVDQTLEAGPPLIHSCLHIPTSSIKMSELDLAGKAAIVTGSSSGVGQAVAIALGKRGCSVVINCVLRTGDVPRKENCLFDRLLLLLSRLLKDTKSVDGANETKQKVEEGGGKAVLCQGDVGKDEDCRRLAQACVDAFGRIDFLVNNAGYTVGRLFGKLWKTIGDADVFVV